MTTERMVYDAEHDMLRASVRTFFEREVAPHYDAWERRGHVDRQVWLRAGAAGLLCATLPEAEGGPGGDILAASVILEEQMRQGFCAPGFYTHSDIVAPYIEAYGSAAVKARWLPAMAGGTAIGAIAMTEPGAGSDLKAIRTTARRDGTDWLIDGQKTFITNGYLADMVIVAAKTDPAAGRAAAGISLFVVDTAMQGFRCSRILEKLGQKAQDTAELFFDDVRVPAEALLGEAGCGFGYMMGQLPRERLLVAVSALGAAKGALARTLAYVRERRAFGRAVADFQNTQFKLAQCQAEILVGEGYVDRCLAELLGGRLSPDRAAVAKLWLTEMQGRVVDTCLQLFGGYGYMAEYPISRAYADARAQRIYGGSNEIMLQIIARSM